MYFSHTHRTFQIDRPLIFGFLLFAISGLSTVGPTYLKASMNIHIIHIYYLYIYIYIYIYIYFVGLECIDTVTVDTCCARNLNVAQYATSR